MSQTGVSTGPGTGPIAWHAVEVDDAVHRLGSDAAQGPIISAFGLWRIAFIGGLLVGLALIFFFQAKSDGDSDEIARAIAVNALVIGQIFYVFNSRFKLDSSVTPNVVRGNKYLLYGVVAVIVAQALFTFAPPFQALFHTDGIPAHEWPWLVLGGVVFFLVVEVEKLVIRTAQARRG